MSSETFESFSAMGKKGHYGVAWCGVAWRGMA